MFNKLLHVCEGWKKNEKVFTSVRVDLSNENKIESDNQKETMKRETRRICKLKKIEACLNDKMTMSLRTSSNTVFPLTSRHMKS